LQYRNHKLIYRRYAGLFFTVCVDVSDNELVSLESIHLFVELLDQYFGNVCELDLVFNFHKVFMILDEYLLGGEVMETSKTFILNKLAELDKIEYSPPSRKLTATGSSAPSRSALSSGRGCVRARREGGVVCGGGLIELYVRGGGC
jgi:hypothetical protein